jgi:hypothetical protein
MRTAIVITGILFALACRGPAQPPQISAATTAGTDPATQGLLPGTHHHPITVAPGTMGRNCL